jgi:hypothetical protein
MRSPGGARQHAVFGRHPALAGIAQPWRHALLQARSAKDMGVAELDQAGAFRMARDIAFEGNGPHFVGLAS